MRGDTYLSSHRVVVRRNVGDEGQNAVDRAKGPAIADDQAAKMAETLLRVSTSSVRLSTLGWGRANAPAVVGLIVSSEVKPGEDRFAPQAKVWSHRRQAVPVGR